jgi:hypothetical protein
LQHMFCKLEGHAAMVDCDCVAWFGGRAATRFLWTLEAKQ